MTEITYTFNEEEISKLSIGEKIQKGYYEVVNEEEWRKDMQAKYGNMSEKCERLQKQLDIAVMCLKKYAEIKDILMVSKDGTCQITLRDCEGYHLARETLKEIEELDEIHKQE